MIYSNMKYKLLICLLFSLFTLCTYPLLFAIDTVPRPVTICSGASIIIKGDPLGLPADSYLWEVLQNGTWTAAPGVNNTADYFASSLLNPLDVSILFNLRRKILLAGGEDWILTISLPCSQYYQL